MAETTTSTAPKLGKITRHNGVAGQFSYSVTVTYPDEPPMRAEFVGSVYGGPVVAISPGFGQTFVFEPARFGKFSPTWVRRYFGTEPL